MSAVHAHRIALAVAAGALLAPGAALAAPTLRTDRACYTPGEPIVLTGGGFAPGGAVSFVFSITGDHGSRIGFGQDDETPDGAGAFTTTYAAPKLASSDDLQEDMFITATPQGLDPSSLPPGSEPPFGAASTLLSTFDVFVPEWDRRQVDPRKTVTVRAFGYEPATRLWAHYVLNGKRVKTVPVGALTGPCGNIVKRMREFPFRPVKAGRYAVYFQPTQTLDKRLGTPYRSVVVPKAKAVR